MNQDILGALFLDGGFSPTNFPDIWDPIWMASLVFLVGTVVLYNVQTRRLHQHPPLVELQEWLFWTGLATFSLLIVYAIFKFYFVFVLVTLVVGIGTLIWIRFVRFPPLIAAYDRALRRERFMSQKRYSDPGSTIRSKAARRPRNRGRSGRKR